MIVKGTVIELCITPILVEVPSTDWYPRYKAIGRRVFAIDTNGKEHEITFTEAKDIYNTWKENVHNAIS